MADKTGIEWTDATWNPIAGCSLVSPGCTNCYAMGIADRFKHAYAGRRWAGAPAEAITRRTNGAAVWTGQVTLAPDHILAQPLRWRKPRKIFVNSMGDLFHEDIPDEWIDRVFAVMALAPQHTFQVLTKRSARMRDYLGTRAGDWSTVWPDANPPGTLPISRFEQRLAMRPDSILRPPFPLPNVWLGVSTEDQRRADERIPDLLATPAAVRFASAEPLLGPINFRRIQVAGGWYDALFGWRDVKEPFPGIDETLDLVIVGGESGPRARPMHPDWARGLRRQCAAAGVPFFFKQWGEFSDAGLSSERWLLRRDGSHLPMPSPEGIGFHPPTDDGACFVYRVGKRAAGRLLDGVEHNGMPEVRG